MIPLMTTFYAANACRYKVVGWLRKKFPTPNNAEVSLGCGQAFTSRSVQTDSPPNICTSETQTEIAAPGSDTQFELEMLSLEFHQLCRKKLGIDIPKNFLVHAGAAMVQLSKSNRSNLLYTLAKGIGTMREDGSDSHFPTKRMTFGLVEYTANFFAAEHMNQVR